MSECPSLVLVEHRFGFLDSTFAPFSTEIDQKLSVRRQVAAPRIHLPVEPLTVLERVSVGVPLHNVKPLARPTTENDPDRSLSGEDDVYPGAGLFRDATHSSVYFFRDDVFHCSELSANAHLDVFDSCCHGLLKEIQHEFAVASTEHPSHLRENGSKQNQSWWNDQSDPRVSSRVVTSSEHVEQREHKYWRTAQNGESKPHSHEIPRPARSIEITLDSAASGLSFNRPIEVTCEIVAAVSPLLQTECTLSNFTDHWSLTFVAREREQSSLFRVNGAAQRVHHSGRGESGMQQDGWRFPEHDCIFASEYPTCPQMRV